MMDYGTTSSELKPLEQTLLPDPRLEFLVLRSPKGERPYLLKDLHYRLSTVMLDSSVPEEVRVQFETAKNLMLYTWFVFEFQTTAEMQAYVTLEFALNARFPKARREVRLKEGGAKLVPLTLAPLLKTAMSEGLFVAESLPAWKRAAAARKWYEEQAPGMMGEPMTPHQWLAALIDGLPKTRNHLAHGKPKLDLFSSLDSLDLCADLINALFRSPIHKAT